MLLHLSRRKNVGKVPCSLFRCVSHCGHNNSKSSIFLSVQYIIVQTGQNTKAQGQSQSPLLLPIVKTKTMPENNLFIPIDYTKFEFEKMFSGLDNIFGF